MARLIRGNRTEEIPDGSRIVEAAGRLGVPFGCYEGVCGACRIEIESGMENLSPLTGHEEEQGCSGTERLACQCTIAGGEARIK
ncbi:(2Fe-2S)-binding protein [Candidatus Woesearchaeota archaeon]|nr:(2Fe-2S)-binding protein [Candidatus Woesearchaeota archaeon]